MVASIWGVRFRKLLSENPGFEKQLCSHTYVENSPLKIRDAFYGCRTEGNKRYYRVKDKEKIHYVEVICLFPYISKYGKFTLGQLNLYVGADCPLTVWIGRVLSDVRFCLLRNCIMWLFRTKASPN